jgi:hypothetical protein
MLDKLVDNAVDFSADGATITIVVRSSDAHAELSVANPGPPLPAETGTRLFESLWQSRSKRTGGRISDWACSIVRLDCRISRRLRSGGQPARRFGRGIHHSPASLSLLPPTRTGHKVSFSRRR